MENPSFFLDYFFMKKVQLSSKLVVFLRENLNFMNSGYLIKKNLGLSTYKTEKYFSIVEESDDEVMIPRGFLPELVEFCRKESIPFKIIDRREKKTASW